MDERRDFGGPCWRWGREMNDEVARGGRSCAWEFVRSIRGERGKGDGWRRSDEEEGGEGSSHREG